MSVEPMEIKLASDEKYHRAHGVDAGVAIQQQRTCERNRAPIYS